MNGCSPSELLRENEARLGQVAVTCANEGWTLCHRDDVGRRDLREVEPAQAAAIALRDEAGRYRPLKTAPNLRRGWKILTTQAEAVIRALDAIYPGRLAVWQAFVDGRLATTPLRETLGRQSGMYRVAARISDAEIDEVVEATCRSDRACLRTILWRRDAAGRTPSPRLPAEKFDPCWDQTGRGESTAPLLCQEPCHLLVAAARAAVKGEQAERAAETN